MSRYADTSRCPDCASVISFEAEACPSCSLPLRGPLPRELYLTLEHADQLLVALRSMSRPAVTAGASTAVQPPPQRRRVTTLPRGSVRISGASVPQLLLGLGALCLLVAALVFLAVTWSVMGVGGRTATLVGLTAVCATTTGLVARKGLRGATEALGLVTLGLVGLDVIGADHAGWFGELAASTLLILLGAVLGVAAAAGCLAVRSTPARSCASAEVVTGLASALVVAGIHLGASTASPSRALLATLLAASGAAGVRRLHLPAAAVAVGSVAGLAWLVLVAVGVATLTDALTVGHVWGDLAAWPLATAALLLSATALVASLPQVVRDGALSVAVAILVSVVISPTLDNGTTPATVAVLTALAAALGVLWLVPSPWSAAAVLTAGLGTAWAAIQSLALVTEALERLDRALSSTGSLGGRLPATQLADGPQPWLLIPDVGLLIVASLVTRRLLGSAVPLRAGIEVAAVSAAAATAVLHPVPVWTVAGGLLAVGLVLLAVDELAVAALVLTAGVGVATYSDAMTAIALAAVLVCATHVHLRDRRDLVAATAGFVATTTLAASVWTWGDLLDHPGSWTAVAGIVGVAVVALGRPAPGVGVGAVIGALGLSCAGLLTVPADRVPTWAAVHLTLAGAATCMESVLRPDRRPLAWAGGLLLVAASWVRLADVGVREPEPYTLPAALALLAVGVVQLRRRPEDDTLRALGPGLGLALTPSLLWVLDDPTTLRSLVLGLASLGLVGAGLRLRWTAPLLFGCVVGAAIVLRSAAPYVGDAVPRWATIGTAGVLLVALGITWEERVRETRVLLGHVRRLR